MKVFLERNYNYYYAHSVNPKMCGYGFTPFEALSRLFGGLAELAEEIHSMGIVAEGKALSIWAIYETK